MPFSTLSDEKRKVLQLKRLELVEKIAAFADSEQMRFFRQQGQRLSHRLVQWRDALVASNLAEESRHTLRRDLDWLRDVRDFFEETQEERIIQRSWQRNALWETFRQFNSHLLSIAAPLFSDAQWAAEDELDRTADRLAFHAFFCAEREAVRLTEAELTERLAALGAIVASASQRDKDLESIFREISVDELTLEAVREEIHAIFLRDKSPFDKAKPDQVIQSTEEKSVPSEIDNGSTFSVDTNNFLQGIDQTMLRCVSNANNNLLGEGGFAVVIRAEYRAAPVAVKMLKKKKENSFKLFHHEALLLQALTSLPTMMHFYGAVFDDARAFFVTDMALFSLHDALERERARLQRAEDKRDSALELSLTTRFAWLAQVAAGLQSLHNVGVLHRDVKSKNVLVGLDGRARLSDFGLSTLLVREKERALKSSSSSKQKSFALCGTAAYLAPELILNLCSSYSEETDVYSLGVLINETLTLAAPFEGLSPRQVKDALSRGERPPLVGDRKKEEAADEQGSDKPRDGLISELRRLVKRSVHSRPRCRPSAQSLSLALQRLGLAFAIQNPLPIDTLRFEECEKLFMAAQHAALGSFEAASSLSKLSLLARQGSLWATGFLLALHAEKHPLTLSLSLPFTEDVIESFLAHSCPLLYEPRLCVAGRAKLHWLRGMALIIGTHNLSKQMQNEPTPDSYQVRELEKQNTLMIAANHFRASAEMGCPSGHFSLGLCFLRGAGVSMNATEAVRHFRIAAQQSHAAAQCALGLCLSAGTGTERDFEQALFFLRVAANNGHADAHFHLATLHLHQRGLEGEEDEEKLAAEHLFLAAERGHEQAQYLLGQCFFGSVGLAKDGEQTVRFLQMSGFCAEKTSCEAVEKDLLRLSELLCASINVPDGNNAEKGPDSFSYYHDYTRLERSYSDSICEGT